MCSECFKSKPAEAWRAIGFNKHLLVVIWRLSLIRVMKSSETLGDIPERSYTHQWNFPKRPPSPFAPQEGLLCKFQRYPQPPPFVWELEDLPCRSAHRYSGLLWTQHAPGWLLSGKCFYWKCKGSQQLPVPWQLFSQCCFSKSHSLNVEFWDNTCRLLLTVESEDAGICRVQSDAVRSLCVQTPTHRTCLASTWEGDG